MDRAHDRRSWTRSPLIYTDSNTPSPSCLTRARVRTRPSRAAYSVAAKSRPKAKTSATVVMETRRTKPFARKPIFALGSGNLGRDIQGYHALHLRALTLIKDR